MHKMLKTVDQGVAGSIAGRFREAERAPSTMAMTKK
jgi:hypothetical protein